MKNIGDLYRFWRPCNFFIDPGLRPVTDFQRKSNIVPYRKSGIQRIVLEGHGDIPGLGRQIVNGLVVKREYSLR